MEITLRTLYFLPGVVVRGQFELHGRTVSEKKCVCVCVCVCVYNYASCLLGTVSLKYLKEGERDLLLEQACTV